ncbi:hypothetical protein [Endozoicomonas sp. ALC020]
MLKNNKPLPLAWQKFTDRNRSHFGAGRTLGSLVALGQYED